MTFEIIYSRIFLEKVFDWTPQMQLMAFQAAEHAALDPDLDDYKRTYLTPFRQKHPTSDHQYTLYFLLLTSTEMFVTWINDPT